MPLKQVIIFREDLNLDKNTQISQCSHVACSFLIARILKDNPIFYLTLTQLFEDSKGTAKKKEGLEEGMEINLPVTHDELKWLSDVAMPEVLSVKNEAALLEVQSKAEAGSIECNIIRSNGQYTCLALGPADVSKIKTITKHLGK